MAPDERLVSSEMFEKGSREDTGMHVLTGQVRPTPSPVYKMPERSESERGMPPLPTPGCYRGKAFPPYSRVRESACALGNTRKPQGLGSGAIQDGAGRTRELMPVQAFAAAHRGSQGAHESSSVERGFDVVQPAGAQACPPAPACCPAEHRHRRSPHKGHPLTLPRVPQSSLRTLLLLHRSVQL